MSSNGMLQHTCSCVFFTAINNIFSVYTDTVFIIRGYNYFDAKTITYDY